MNFRLLLLLLLSWAAVCSAPAAGELLMELGPEQIVQAGEPAVDLAVSAYSVPSYVDWDNDGDNDLIIGEGGGGFPGYIRVYLNNGSRSVPAFYGFSYVQSGGGNLTYAGGDVIYGCLGLFPRVVYWDNDSRKDLVVGLADGYVKLFLNINTDVDPTFDSGSFLQVGPTGSKVNINVGYRATPCVVDWNSDGKKDLVIGALDGKIHIFINEGTDTVPDFVTEIFAQQDAGDLIVPELRSSPQVRDLDGDGKKDLLAGNTYGQLIFYPNAGTENAPAFSAYEYVKSNGSIIDLPDSPRSRPFLCDWSGEGYLDVIIGAVDGKVHLYEGLPIAGDLDVDTDVDLADFARFAMRWLDTDCGDCGRSDLNGDHNVDMIDLYIFVEYCWLRDIDF